MKISEILTLDGVVIDSKADNKKQLLQELAAKAAEISEIDERLIFDTVLERENLGSTGFGSGTALPHARISETENVFGVFVRLKSPVDFDAIDGKPVDLVFMLLSPENSGADHLTALAQVSRLLKDDDTRKKLRAANNQEEIYSLLLG